MAAIERIIEDIATRKITLVAADAALFLKDKPTVIADLFKPLYDAGFHDFDWAGSGGDAFFVRPVDNDKIVFRISTENNERKNNTPFFLCSAYESSVKSPAGRAKIEILLAGQKKIVDEDKTFLLDEMKKAGWNIKQIDDIEGFWRDVVRILIRGRDGRTKTIPIVSDPSALSNYLVDAMPPRDKLNSCGPNYISLQDQAAAYNAIIENDHRLKKLILEPVKFPETEIIPVKTTPLPPPM